VLGYSSALDINAAYCEVGFLGVDEPWLAQLFAAHLG
jgi:hypothetical protein